MRTEASGELRAVIREIEQAAGLPPVDRWSSRESPDTTLVRASDLGGRMGGLFHSGYHRAVVEPLRALPATRCATVGELARRVFQPPRGKRVHVDDPQYGLPFFGTAELMQSDPDPKYLLAKRTPSFGDFIVDEKTVLVPRSGQLNGIIGHAVLPYGDVVGGAVTEHAIRVCCPSERTAGYLFACLSSEYARRQLKARAFGSSIPSLDGRGIEAVLLPKLDDARMEELGLRAFAVRTKRHDAIDREREAGALVECWIEVRAGA